MNILELTFIFKWWLVLLLIGISFFPLTAKIFSPFKDKGYIFSKFLGLLLISYTVYILSSIQIIKFNVLSIFFIWFLLSIISILILRKEKFELKKHIKIIVAEELIFLIGLILWSYVRGFNPDIHNLEKFMDFGFINSILRTDYFPSKDMWFTPLSINYYYFGHLYTAVLTKITNIPSSITFNLMIATIFSFTFSFSFSIGINLVQSIKDFSLKKLLFIGGIFGYIVALSGNLHTIYSFFTPYNTDSPRPFWESVFNISSFPNSYWYPNATRFIHNTIHEFPSYSFVVADLHGHVLSIPIVMTIIAIFLLIFINKKIDYSKTILISFLIALAYMTNAWDGLIYIAIFILVILSVSFVNQNSDIKKRITFSFINFFKHGIILGLSFFIFTFIFNQSFSPFASGIGLNCSPNFLVDIGKIGPLIFEKDKCQTTPIWQFFILYGFFIFMFTSFLIFLRKKKILTTDYFVLVLSFFSFFLLIIPEFIYLKDIYTGHFRANTMFKLSYQAFIMLSISSVYILVRITQAKSLIKNFYSKILLGIFLLIAFGMFFLISIYPYFSVPAGYKNLDNFEGLTGTKYLESIKPEDYRAINWINANIKGQPVILEAQGDSYTDYARISSNTGLPTVLGWTVHEWLWRGSYDIPSARFNDLKTIFESEDLSDTQKIIDKYNISYIYIGVLENEKYNVYDAKFLELGEIIYKDGKTTIYKVN